MLNKKSLRALALGFFLSGSLVAGYIFLEEDASPQTSNDQEVEELEQEIASLEEELAQLEVAQATQEQEEAEEEEPEETEEEPESDEEDSEEDDTDTEEDADAEEESEDEDEEDEEEDDVISTTITLADGQASSVATQQLAEAGIIDDRLEFDLFLDDNDYARLVRPGTYEVDSEMSYEELAAALRGQ